MTERRPLVRQGGRNRQLPPGDTLPMAWDELKTVAAVSGVATLDLSSPAGFRVSLTGDTTLAFSNVPAGRVVVFTVVFVQDATGGRVVAFPANVKADGGGVVAQPATAAGAITVQSFYTDDGGATIWQAADGGALYRRSNVLGTVSQAGGVPTGAIIERGSNANGEYVRFADGTQICTRVRTAVPITTTSRTEGSFTVYLVGETWNYPANFISNPSVASAQRGATSASTVSTINFVSLNVISGSSVLLNRSFSLQASVMDLCVDIAIGRWY